MINSNSFPKYYSDDLIDRFTYDRNIEAQKSFKIQNPEGPRISHTIYPSEMLSVKDRMKHIGDEIIKIRQKI